MEREIWLPDEERNFSRSSCFYWRFSTVVFWGMENVRHAVFGFTPSNSAWLLPRPTNMHIYLGKLVVAGPFFGRGRSAPQLRVAL